MLTGLPFSIAIASAELLCGEGFPGIAALLLVWPALLAANVYLVERRGRGRPLDRNRQLEISTLLESIPDSVFIFDTDSRVVDLNRSAEQLCACSREQLAGASLRDLVQRLGVQERGRTLELRELAVVRALQGEPLPRQKRSMRHPGTGQAMEVVVSANPIRDASGALSGALVVVRDITEYAELQRRINDVERHRAIGQMAAGLAHDFNNVLETIIQAVAILEMSADKPAQERQSYLDMVKHAVRRGAEIIGHVRDYLRTGTGPASEVRIDNLLSEVIDLTRPLWQVSRSIELKGELRPVRPVMANAADLRRVFTNLVINAIEAMPQGGKVTVGCEQQGGSVLAYVADTGEGIRPEHKEKIFYPYFTTKPGGTGLGLSGAQRIVLSNGGAISFSSEVGQGARFEVRFPVSKGEERPGPSPEEKAA